MREWEGGERGEGGGEGEVEEEGGECEKGVHFDGVSARNARDGRQVDMENIAHAKAKIATFLFAPGTVTFANYRTS